MAHRKTVPETNVKETAGTELGDTVTGLSDMACLECLKPTPQSASRSLALPTGSRLSFASYATDGRDRGPAHPQPFQLQLHAADQFSVAHPVQ